MLSGHCGILVKKDQPVWFILIFFFLIYFWLSWVFVAARGLSLVAASGGLFFVAVHGVLTAVASLVVEHGLQASGIQQLWFVASRAQAQQL